MQAEMPAKRRAALAGVAQTAGMAATLPFSGPELGVLKASRTLLPYLAKHAAFGAVANAAPGVIGNTVAGMDPRQIASEAGHDAGIGAGIGATAAIALPAAIAGGAALADKLENSQAVPRAIKSLGRVMDYANENLAPGLTTRDVGAVPNPRAPNEDLQRIAQQYINDNSIESLRLPRVTAVDEDKARMMARYYDMMPNEPDNPAVIAAHKKFAEEVEAQAQALRDAGYSWTPVEKDPYKNSAEMLADLRDNKHIYTYAATPDQASPMASLETQNTFRAIHDILGHGQFGNQFGPIGEENAFRDHAAMFSPEARKVMASLTRGQNSWVNFGPNAHLPVRERPFAAQKAAIWPDELRGDYKDMKFPPVPAEAPFKAYSQLMTDLENAPMDKATGAQWAKALGSKLSRNERDFSGVDKLLADNQNNVLTRDQIREHYAKNPLRLGGQTLAARTINHQSKYALPEVIDAVRSATGGADDVVMTLDNDGDAYRALQKKFPDLIAENENWANIVARDVFGDMDTRPARFGTYTIPGGKNYREVLTTLKNPPAPVDPMSAAEHGEYDVLRRKRFPNLSPEERVRFNELHEKRVAHDKAVMAWKEILPDVYSSPHWDERNVLAHTRLTDRELPNGERATHAEESQSDWGQHGRTSGFAGDYEKKLPALNAEFQRLGNAYDEAARQGDAASLAQITDRMKQIQDTRQELFNAVEFGAVVPEGPYVHKTDDWTELNIKRALDDAARNGSDRLSWSTGAQNAGLYDLSKQVDELYYDPSSNLFVATKNGTSVHDGTYDAKALPSVVGKEVAQRLLAATPDKDGILVLRGDGLHVGGEGMHQYYDNMFPKTIKDYVKRLGHKVEVEPIPWGSGRITGNSSIRIPPALRRQILERGQPLGAADPRLLRGITGAGVGAVVGGTQGDDRHSAAAGAAIGGLAGGLFGVAPEVAGKVLDVAENKNLLSGVYRTSPERFVRAMEGFRVTNPEQAGYLDWAGPDVLREKGMKTYLSRDGKTGIAYNPANGYMGNLFSGKGAQRGRGARAFSKVLAKGGSNGNAFDTGLGDFYRDFGMQETDRYPWNDQHAPEGWDTEKQGRPEVFEFMHPDAGKKSRKDFERAYKAARAARKAIRKH